MKICMVHNEYGIFTGEESVVYNICHLLEGRGHTVIRFFRSSTEIPKMRLGKARAFYQNAIFLGRQRLRSDYWPLNYTKYKEYPEAMIDLIRTSEDT